jgi:hypothetical protein
MIIDEVWNSIGKQSGSVVHSSMMFCYNIEGNSEKHDHEIYIFNYNKLVAYSYQNVEKNKHTLLVPNSSKFIFESFIKTGGEIIDNLTWQQNLFSGLYTLLVATINFFKYAEVEDKLIKANSKSVHEKVKYVNDTKTDIHFITSQYITNLYVEGAFKVRGHWRLQPKKKNGEWTKELIWIREFEKSGYTRKAGKEQHPEANL